MDKFKVRGLIVALEPDSRQHDPNQKLITNMFLCKQSNMICADALPRVTPSRVEKLKDDIEAIMKEIDRDP